MKLFKQTNFWLALSLIVIGVLLVVYPSVSASVVCYVIAGWLVAMGIWKIAVYVTLPIRSVLYRNDLVLGLFWLILGTVVFLKKDVLLELVPLLLGLIVFVSGIRKVQNAYIARKIGYTASLSYMVLGIICMVLGIVAMFFLSGEFAAKTLFTIIGIFFIFAGISDTYITVFLTGKYNHFMKEYENKNVIDVEVTDEREKNS